MNRLVTLNNQWFQPFLIGGGLPSGWQHFQPRHSSGNTWQDQAYTIMVHVEAHKVFQFVVTAACVAVFVMMIQQQYDVFSQEPTGSSLKTRPMEDMPFPGGYAVSASC